MPLQLLSGWRKLGRPGIDRVPSPALALLTPWLLVMLGSLVPGWPILPSATLLPPIGFMLLLGWQQLRPGLLPVWAGLPLGLFDDLFSGQPLGSAVLLWSVVMIGLDLMEMLFPWRGFLQNWLVAAATLSAYLLIGLYLANLAGGSAPLAAIIPQMLMAILGYPVIARLVGMVDRFRLIPLKAL